jgi:1-phosphatidylinositol phosphodiesterase
MSQLSGKNALFSISIPGTHDSGTYKVSRIVRVGWVTTQSWSITEQLNAGIRYLDIRCRQINDVCQIYHGDWSAYINFDDVLYQIFRFLDKYTGETIIMRLVEQSNGHDNKKSFQQMLSIFYSNYNNYFYKVPNNMLNPYLVSLDMTKGKLVVLVDFNTDTPFAYGFKYSDFLIQDDYAAAVDVKKNKIMSFVETTFQSMIINYLSGYFTGVPLTNPADYSHVMNPFMTDLIKKKKPDYVGIVPADFPDSELISAIIDTNRNRV